MILKSVLDLIGNTPILKLGGLGDPNPADILVKPEYLDAAHDAVIRKYGSMDSYLRQGLGISDEMIQKLRSELLE